MAARLLAEKGSLEASDVAYAASHGDPVSLELIADAGRLIGRMLAAIVNLFNPSLIVIGGGVAASGDVLLATIRESVYRRSLPLATRTSPSSAPPWTARRRDRCRGHGDGRAVRPGAAGPVDRRRDAQDAFGHGADARNVKLGLLTAAFPGSCARTGCRVVRRSRVRDARSRVLARVGRRGARKYEGVCHIDVGVRPGRRA